MKDVVFIVRNDKDMRIVVSGDEQAREALSYSRCTLRWPPGYQRYTCRIRIDGIRCHRIVMGGIRTPMWVRP